MRQRKKAGRPDLLFLNFLWRQGGEFLPGHALGQLDAHAILHRLAARHGRSLDWSVSQVVALRQQSLLALLEGRFLRLKAFCQRGEVFLYSGNGQRAADKQRDREGRPGPMDTESGFHGSPFMWVVVYSCYKALRDPTKTRSAHNAFGAS